MLFDRFLGVRPKACRLRCIYLYRLSQGLLFPFVKPDCVFPNCLFSSVSGKFPWCHIVSPELGECVQHITSGQSMWHNTAVTCHSYIAPFCNLSWEYQTVPVGGTCSLLHLFISFLSTKLCSVTCQTALLYPLLSPFFLYAFLILSSVCFFVISFFSGLQMPAGALLQNINISCGSHPVFYRANITDIYTGPVA